MDTQNQIVLVDKSDFSRLVPVEHTSAPLKDGHIRVDIGPFALTANNITYMVTGNQIGYWQFFDPSAYGITAPGEDMSALGAMPVWGYGIITESRCAALAVGTPIYGFFPVAKTIDLQPVKISQSGFQDGAPHRQALHPVYNTYALIGADPSFGAHPLYQPVLRPLFTTSFLIDDFLAVQDFFGAQQVLLLSASSKTALGSAYCLKARGTAKVSGLTSARHVDFVKDTGFYDAVHSYAQIKTMNGAVKTAIVDMAGDGAVNAALYAHFGDNIVYNCMVGKSHWQGDAPPKSARGAPPVLFFAPDQAKQRFADWGPDGFARALSARFGPFCDGAKDWLGVEMHWGLSAFESVYKDVLSGRVDPAKTSLLTLKER